MKIEQARERKSQGREGAKAVKVNGVCKIVGNLLLSK